MTSETRLIKIGEIDSDYGGDSFDLKHKELSQIFVSTGDGGINSIQFQYMENGKYVLSEQYGSKYITEQFHTIELNHPDEYITGVYGQYYYAKGSIMVITFTSNIQEYGPFGNTDPNAQKRTALKSFTYSLGKSCQFGGFHGAYNESCLISLGLYLSPKIVPPGFGSKSPEIVATWV